MKELTSKQKARKELLLERNRQVRKCFYDTQKKKPKYTVEAIIEEVASKFYLSPRTIDGIISFEGIYRDS